ncbi:7520_t:CDS:2 [Ambispora gerdemannii]|uniref:Transmembrane protein 198 n=1 Tax=Ambispora gerdemannii TaxID=144530 RepID=A0A9N9B1Q1_9GLOM|nr:7520_t:CDS:2 [Ambispora gerdemannii]
MWFKIITFLGVIIYDNDYNKKKFRLKKKLSIKFLIFYFILISSPIYASDADDSNNVDISSTISQDGYTTAASSLSISPSIIAPATITSLNVASTTEITNTTPLQTIISVTTSPISPSSTFTSNNVISTVSSSNNSISGDGSNDSDKKDYSPAYNATYGTPPQPLRTTITWSNVFYGVFFICVGLLEVFHGYKYIRITLLIMGYLFFSSTALIILLFVDNNSGGKRTVTFYFTTWLLVGLIGGSLGFFCWHLGLMLTAAYGGYVLSLSLLAILNIENHVIRWITALIMMLLLAIMVHYFERTVIIFTTSIVGAYSVMYGVDEFARQGFRDMIQLANADGFFRFHPTLGVYLMIAGVICLAGIGIVYEYRAHEKPIGHFWCGDGHRRREGNPPTNPIPRISSLTLRTLITKAITEIFGVVKSGIHVDVLDWPSDDEIFEEFNSTSNTLKKEINDGIIRVPTGDLTTVWSALTLYSTTLDVGNSDIKKELRFEVLNSSPYLMGLVADSRAWGRQLFYG